MDEALSIETARDEDNRQGPVVLQVLPRLVSGGVERGTIEIAKAVRDAGGTAIVASAGGPLVRELDRLRVRHVALPLASKNPFVIRANIGRLRALIRGAGVDIVHARSRAPAWSAYYAVRGTKARLVTTFHGTYGAKGPLKRAYNSVMTRGERVIAISQFIADHVRSTYGTDPDRIRLIHRGVDVDLFAPDRVSGERLRRLAQQWRLPDGRSVVMLPARLTRWKGHGILIEAVARLKRWDLCVVLVGEEGRDGYRRELEKLVVRHGLESVVRIVGNCPDMPAAYMLADVVVHASTDPEAFGRVIVEAMAMGRPVIATDHGAPPEVVTPQTGWLVPPGDPEQLAQALWEALSLTAEARSALAAAARERVVAHFTRDAMCAATLAVYEEVLSAGEPIVRA